MTVLLSPSDLEVRYINACRFMRDNSRISLRNLRRTAPLELDEL